MTDEARRGAETTDRQKSDHVGESRPLIVISPRGRFSSVDARELWQFRDLLFAFAARDVRLRYRQTALGIIWVVLQPLLAAAVFAFLFGRVARFPSGHLPYLVFAFAGLIAWTTFNTILTRASTSLLNASSMVSKVYFPRLLLPLSVLGSALLDFAVGLALMVGFLLWYQVPVGWSMLTLPLWLLLVTTLGTGVGLVFASLAVRYRDIQFVVPVIVQLLLFATPVAYAASVVPPSLQWVVVANPLTGLFEGFRWSLLQTPLPGVGQIVYAVSVTLAAAVVGALTFSSLEKGFADVI